jgi:single-stranded-DNA-specific exonuclease
MNYNSVSGKNWVFKKYNSLDIEKYSQDYSLNEIVAKLLSIRKKNIENVDFFLNPTIKNLLPNPNILKDMSKATERTFECIKNHEKLGIFGDYDVDGATSTALLKLYFTSIKQKISTYIPDRKKEGYGPTKEGFNNLIDLGSKIIFTVDCGTLSFEPIKLAQNKNIDVIVLDHHQSDVKIPNAYAVVNPNRYDDTSRLNYLCAAGVCFMFLVSLNKKLRDSNWFNQNNISEPNIINFLDLVSLGTVCDVVPLIGLNRAIVKQGLKIIKKRSNLGLKTLYDLCKIESNPTTYDLGYILGPRINAGGRVGKSSHGADLLSSTDVQKAYKLATDLDKSNKERKSIELLLSQKIDSEVEKVLKDPVIVLSGSDWHEGIIGIVASRIKEKYNKPTFLISQNENFGKGSARSIVGFDIGSAIIKAVQSNILIKGGGHKMAGGFSLKNEKIVKFKEFITNEFQKTSLRISKNLNLYLDSIITPTSLNEKFFEEVNFLSPFGSGNNEPKFVLENLKVISSRVVGSNHIKTILIGSDGTIIKTIAFNAKNTNLESYLNKSNKKMFNIAGKIKLNEWKGEKKVEFEIDDISVN